MQSSSRTKAGEWTHAILEQSLAEGLIPGAVVSAFELRKGGSYQLLAAGKRRVEPTALEMKEDTLFDWASLTKVLATTPLIWRAIQRGWISEETPVHQLIEGCPESWKGIQVAHLLAHCAGFRAWEPVWQGLKNQWGSRLPEISVQERQRALRARILNEVPEAAPGTRTLYSDFSFLLLGFILEELHQKPLDLIWKTEFSGIDAGYRRVLRPASVTQPIDNRCAATEFCDWRGGWLQGEVHDENCWSMGGYGGHAGLFGNMQDLISVTRRIFDPGFLAPGLRARMLAPVRGPQGPVRTLGWDLPDGPESSAGPTLAGRSGVVGHLGFTGTSLWVDPRSGWAFSVLTARVHLGREHLGIRKFRPRIHDAMALDLTLG